MCINQIYVLFSVLLFSDTFTAVIGQTFECVYDLEDFVKHGWEEDQAGSLKYATNSTYLPENFKLQPGLQSGNGIWYFDGSKDIDNLALYKPVEYFEKEPVAYIYIKYYAHIESDGDRVRKAYLFPMALSGGAEIVELQLSTDFKWREAFFQIKMDSIIDESQYGLEIGTLYFKSKDFLFIDTINIVQGTSMSDIQDFLSFCPLNNEA